MTLISCYYCCWTAVVMLFTGFVLSPSTAQSMTREEQEEYLRQFAHLGEDNPDPRMQQYRSDPDQQFALAVSSFQRMAGLNVTGVIDHDTIQAMMLPRCGVVDIKVMGNIARRRKRYALTGSRWNKLLLTYRFTPGRGYTPDLPQPTITKIFQQAFKMWSDVSDLTFAETSSLADIEIIFASRDHGDQNPFDGPGRTLAHAYFPTTHSIGGDAHFDEDETWTDRTYSGINLLQVAVHEIGHSLGLGHSNQRDAIMAPFYRGYKPNPSLHQDDIDGIRYLYGNGGPGATTLGPRQSTAPSVGTAPPPLPTSDYCPLAGFCRDFDAIDVINNRIHVFKGEFYATLSSYGTITDMRRIRDRWPSLPESLDAVMATYSYVFFFKGDLYWRLHKRQNTLSQRYISVGFPRAPHNIDAAFVWSGNGRIYFIKGNQYYRYRYGWGIDYGYPRPLSVWRGVEGPIDDAFQYNGVTYFFSGAFYQVFDDSRFIARSRRLTRDMMQCCSRDQQQFADFIDGRSSATKTSNFASNSQVVLSLLLFSLVSAFF